MSIFKALSRFACAAACMGMVGCAVFTGYHADITQGRVLTGTQIAAVKKGMTRDQVLSRLGRPLMDHLLNDDQLVYVYTYNPAYGKLKQRQVQIAFTHGHVTSIISKGYISR